VWVDRTGATTSKVGSPGLGEDLEMGWRFGGGSWPSLCQSLKSSNLLQDSNPSKAPDSNADCSFSCTAAFECSFFFGQFLTACSVVSLAPLIFHFCQDCLR
jgi:hypothetical protein